jgi:uncharacterized protein
MSRYPDFSSGNLVLTIKRWIDNGGTLHQVINDSGWSFLHVAAEYSDVAAIEYLFSSGCDLNVRDFNGTTSLHRAIDAEIDGSVQTDEPLDFKTTKRLIELGADLTIQDNAGDTPIDVVDAYGERARIIFDKMLMPIR